MHLFILERALTAGLPRYALLLGKRLGCESMLIGLSTYISLCVWRWRKAGSFLPHSSFVFSNQNSRNCVWVAGGLSPCECVC